MTTVSLPLSAERTTISLSLRRSRIASCCLLVKLSFGSLDELMMEPTSNLSCFADASSRRAAVHSVAAMMSIGWGSVRG